VGGPNVTWFTHPSERASYPNEGLDTVAGILERAECVRRLPQRSNLRLRVGPSLVHVKHTHPLVSSRFPLNEPRRRSPEAAGIDIANACGVPVPRLIFEGWDGALGAVVGTADLAPARPLDDLLREGALTGRARRLVLRDLAACVARLHEMDYQHRDLYCNHVFVDPKRDGPLVAIIDWDRVRGIIARLGRGVVKDLAALHASAPDAVTDGERVRFLVRYLRARDVLPCRHFARLSRRIERKARRIRAHVPKTPVGDAARPGGENA
jgi:hypothetical protein